MAQPPAYTPAYNFSDYQTSNPADPLPGNRLDIELAAVKTTTDGIRTNLALIQRDDGAIANQVVTPDSFTAASLALIGGSWAPRGAWATTTAYAVGDVVSNSGNSYVCAVAHTAGTFATDLAASKWLIIEAGSYAADDIVYDNGVSALAATDVQAAIDELASEKANSADLGGAALLDVGTVAGTVAAGDHVQALANGGTGATTAAGARAALDVDQATNSLTAEAAADDADLVTVYDNSAGAMRKMTRANFLAGVSGQDTTARDMAILNAFDISELMGRSALSLGAAVVDAFEDQAGIDAATSTGELFDAAGTYGTVADVTQTDNRARTNILFGAGREFVDLFQAATNGGVIGSISVYTTVAFTGQVAVYRDNGAGNYTVMAEQAAVHAGAGWQTFTLSSPYTVPSSGTFYVGCYRPAATFEVVTGGGAAYGGAVGVGASFTKDVNDTVPCAFVETLTSAAMTLVSEAITAASAPASARVTLDHEDVAGTAVLNTDVVVSASRDDGTTYTAAVLTVLRDAGSGRKVYVADIDLSGQPSGTALRLKGEQLNAKAGRWHRWAVQADVALSF
ncbi:carbohydrate-binding protein [Shumkonia mesophila]|uniref:carbohydrate-binding protein n=1 Tax=Shumkonia mesophila TaxID=2838854 RepID=UPI002934E2F0|nr:carbohydrate-binding protein [Shumkonia mesophila]